MCNKQKLEKATSFKKGDKVWHHYHGNLIVVQPCEKDNLFHKVKDDCRIVLSKTHGVLYKGHYEEGSIEITGTPVFENPFKQGDLVWVSDSDNSEWSVRYYSHYDEEHKMHLCYSDQKKVSPYTTYWKQILPFSQNPLL